VNQSHHLCGAAVRALMFCERHRGISIIRGQRANLLRIQHSNSLCSLVLLFLYIEFISSLDALHSVHYSLYLHTLPRSKLSL